MCRRAFFATLVMLFSIGVGPSAAASFDAGQEQSRAQMTDRLQSLAERVERSYEESLSQAGKSKEEKPEADEEESPADVKLPIDKVIFEGNTVIANEDIVLLIKPFQGSALSLSEAKAVAKIITNYYRSQGYISSRAYIPPQKLENKTLVIKIFEGHIGQIRPQRNRFFKSPTIKRHFNHLAGKVLQYSDVVKASRKANRHPDRAVKALIARGIEDGTSDLIIDVEEKLPLHIGAEINNSGSELTGFNRYSVSVRNTNLFGHEDIFSSSIQAGERMHGFFMQYTVPVPETQGEFGGSFNYTEVTFGSDFAILDLAGTARSWSLFYNHPFYENSFISLTSTNAVESKTIRNTVINLLTSKDELRLLHTGIVAEVADPWGRSIVSNDLTFGVPAWGGDDKNHPLLSRAGAGANFFKYNSTAQRLHPVWDKTYLLLRTNLQLTPDKLVSAEQFEIGGASTVRGYPSGEYSGDYGAVAAAEFRAPLYFLPRSWRFPGSHDRLWENTHWTMFFDAGYAKIRSAAPGQSPTANCRGVGTGIRFDFSRHFFGRVEYSVPMGDPPSDGSKKQWYFSLGGELP